MAFLNHIEVNLYTRAVQQYISLNSDLLSNLLRKTAIKTNLYFPAEEDSVCIRKKSVSVNNKGRDFDANFL